MEEFINFFKIKKNIINVLSLAILVLAIPLGINLVRQQQILRSKAAVESIVFTGPNVKEINGRKVATASSIIVQVTAPDDTGAASSTSNSSSNSSSGSSTGSSSSGGFGSSSSSSLSLGDALDRGVFQTSIPADLTAEQITAEANQIIGSSNWRTEENQLKLRRNLFEKYFGREGEWLTPQQIAKFKQARPDIGKFINDRSEGGNADGVILGEWFPGGSRDTDAQRLLLQIVREDSGKPITTPDQVLAMVGVKETLIGMALGPEGSRDWPATCFLRQWMKIGSQSNDPNVKKAQKIMQQMQGQVGFDDGVFQRGCDRFQGRSSFLPWDLVGTVYAGHSCPTNDLNRFCGGDGNVWKDACVGDNSDVVEHFPEEDCGGRGCENGQCKSGGGDGCQEQVLREYDQCGSVDSCRNMSPKPWENTVHVKEIKDCNNNIVYDCQDLGKLAGQCGNAGGGGGSCTGRPSGVPENKWKQKDASVSYNCTNNKIGNTCVGVPYQCRNGQWVLYEPPGLAGEPTNVCNGLCSGGGSTPPGGGTTPPGGGTTPPGAATITQFKLVQDVADFDSTNFTSYVRGSVSVPVTFKNVSPGTKTIYVRFYDASGNKVSEKSANIELLGADPVMASCSLDSSGTSVTFEIKGTGFGNDKGTVKHKSNNLNIDDWQDNTVKAVLNNPPTGSSFLLEIAKPNGQKVQGYCSAVSQLSLGAKTFCRAPSKHDQSDVDISVIEATSTAVLRKEKVKITKEGLVEGLTIKLEANKKYKIGIKAPKTLRRVVEATAAGGTLSIPNFVLPVGDIFPIENGDGKINSLDKAELNRQWVVGIDAANRSGDFNQDSRVNSIDWACMRFDFNKDGDPEPKN